MTTAPLRTVGMLAATAIAGLSMLAVAQAAPRTQVVKTESGAKIALYDSLCDEDNAVECLIAELGCDGPGDVSATLFDLNARDAASVFAKSNGKGSLSAGGVGLVLQVLKLTLSEHTFNWDVSTSSLEPNTGLWSAIGGADAVQIQVGTKKVTLRRADIEESALRSVVETCGAPR